jgi:GntR family transcriptional regulator
VAGSSGEPSVAGGLGEVVGGLGPASVAGGLGPAAIEVRDRLRGEITAGQLVPGQRLGAEREISERLGVSRSTVRAALADLERAGAIRRLRGRGGGIFVAERKVERDLTSLEGLPAYLRRQGFASDARVISTATAACDEEVAGGLGISPGDLVHEVVRVRLADGDPISLERATFPASRFPGLLDHSLSGSLYELLQAQYGLEPGEAEERIEVVDAGTAEARLLGLARGGSLVAISRTAWDNDGAAFEYSHDLFRGDRVRIVVRAQSAPKSRALVAASVEVV